MNEKCVYSGQRRQSALSRAQQAFCYSKTASCLVFGSEIKAITADPAISSDPCYAAITLYLTYQYVPSPLAAFEGISRLPAGHFLLCNTEGTLRVSRY